MSLCVSRSFQAYLTEEAKGKEHVFQQNLMQAYSELSPIEFTETYSQASICCKMVVKAVDGEP